MVRRLAPLALALLCATGCASNVVPNRPEAIAMAYAKAGRHPEAAREIELAVRARPKDAALRQHAAGIQAGAGNLDKAVEHLEVAIQLAPFDPESWLALGELEKRRDSPADAYVAFRRAAELAPEDLRAVSSLALAADSLGFDEEADRAYARWTELQRWSQPLAAPPARP
ncbi:MAG: tetratricopeptide repeat protein [Myxococcales bacterium]|nr:MAG: tetratricopeptide repeat protein [Myxococcales bacterium]